MDSGFVAMATLGGTMMNNPSAWNITDNEYKVYDHAITGIDVELWYEIVDTEIDLDELFEITIPGSGDFVLVRNFITDHQGKT
jgi:hypothetical protein